tara:strand:+ start:5010 stop:5462 length:453 start_codon:yes stop_codon:yes gene_type:complete
MLRLSKKTDYAIILLTHLGGAKIPVSAQEVANVYSLPYPMVANILKKLVRSGLIASSRGQKGGYSLAKSSEKIKLSEIIEATDRPFKLVECSRDECTCKVHLKCPTRMPLLGLHFKIQRFFDETTLFSIIKETKFNSSLMESNYEITNLS